MKKVVAGVLSCILLVVVMLPVHAAEYSASLSNIQDSVDYINAHITQGALANQRLGVLAEQLYAFNAAFQSSDEFPSEEDLKILLQVQEVLYDIDSDGADKAWTALNAVKLTLWSKLQERAQAATPTPAPTAKPAQGIVFDDLDGFEWAKSAIMDSVDKGLFKGTREIGADGVGSFSPANTLTRAEFVTVLTRYLYPDEVANTQGGQWWEPSYKVASNHNLIVSGDAIQSNFSGYMNREEMAYVLVRAVEEKEGKTDKIVDRSQIPDMNKVSNEYAYYVRKAYTLGLITGKDGGVFDPQGPLTRAEAATVAYRLTTPSARKGVEPIKSGSTGKPLDYDSRYDENTNPQEWREGQPHNKPKVGDVVIKADGTRVTLQATKVGSKTILGMADGVPQGVDPYTGIQYSDGTTLGLGGIPFLGDGSPTVKDELTGSVFLRSEWVIIEPYYYPERQGSYDGEVCNYWFQWSEEMGQWFWIGQLSNR